MRIHEFITNEAISITQHSKSFEDAIRKGLAKGFGELGAIRGRFPDQERAFNSGYSNQLRIALTDFLEKTVADEISQSLLDACSHSLGKNVVTYIGFKKTTDRWGGYANGTSIVINQNLLDSLLSKTLDNLITTTFDSYGEGEFVNGLYTGAKEFASGDRNITHVILERNEQKIIRDIVSVLIHELVHVMQHKAQYNKGRTGTEYRSYLDKKKGEFRSKHDLTSANNDSAENDRYYDLYYSSPQEIGAFAHQAALDVIQDSYLDDTDNLEDLRAYASEIDKNTIMYAINKRIGERFKKPRNAKELNVYKRYVKLVYLEVQRYIENLTKRIGNTLDTHDE